MADLGNGHIIGHTTSVFMPKIQWLHNILCPFLFSCFRHNISIWLSKVLIIYKETGSWQIISGVKEDWGCQIMRNRKRRLMYRISQNLQFESKNGYYARQKNASLNDAEFWSQSLGMQYLIRKMRLSNWPKCWNDHGLERLFGAIWVDPT